MSFDLDHWKSDLPQLWLADRNKIQKQQNVNSETEKYESSSLRHMVRTRFRIYIIPIRWSTKRLHYYALVPRKWGTKSASGRSVGPTTTRTDVLSVAVGRRVHVAPNLRVRFVVANWLATTTTTESPKLVERALLVLILSPRWPPPPNPHPSSPIPPHRLRLRRASPLPSSLSHFPSFGKSPKNGWLYPAVIVSPIQMFFKVERHQHRIATHFVPCPYLLKNCTPETRWSCKFLLRSVA